MLPHRIQGSQRVGHRGSENHSVRSAIAARDFCVEQLATIDIVVNHD
jgi:hypothetical protein